MKLTAPSTRRWKLVFAAAVAVSLAALLASSAPAATHLVETSSGQVVSTTLPIEVSSGETEPPPPVTELQPCTKNASGKPVPRLGSVPDPQITKIEGGGRKYSYAYPGLPGGLTVSEPPKGFEPLKASDAELENWGFPPRPPHESERGQWREMVGNYHEAAVSQGCVEPHAQNKTLGDVYDYSWAGYVAENERNPNKWHAVIGTFYEAYEHGSCSPEAQVSQWVGLGGVYTGRFIQTGTTAAQNGTNWAWIEFYAGEYHPPQYVIPGFAVYPQNYMEFYAGYNSSLQESYFYATNTATHQTELTQTPLGPQFYDGSTAEWIDEAPWVVGNKPLYERPLYNFGEITWWNNRAQNEANEVLPIESWQNRRWISRHEGVWSHAPSWPLSNYSNFSDTYYSC